MVPANCKGPPRLCGAGGTLRRSNYRRIPWRQPGRTPRVSSAISRPRPRGSGPPFILPRMKPSSGSASSDQQRCGGLCQRAQHWVASRRRPSTKGAGDDHVQADIGSPGHPRRGLLQRRIEARRQLLNVIDDQEDLRVPLHQAQGQQLFGRRGPAVARGGTVPHPARSSSLRRRRGCRRTSRRRSVPSVVIGQLTGEGRQATPVPRA